MTGWHPIPDVDCAGCGRTVLHRGTCWSQRHRGRVCCDCHTPGPAAADYEPAALVAALNRQEQP